MISPIESTASDHRVRAGAGRGHWVTYDVIDGLVGADVRALIQGRDSDFWLATYGGGISRFDGENFYNLSSADGLAHDAVYCALETRSGDLYFGTAGGGISRFDGEKFYNLDSANGLANNVVYCALETRSGDLYFGTEGGISRFDGENFYNIDSADGLPFPIVYCALEAADGTLYFGTAGGGLSRFDGKSFTNFSLEHGLPNAIVESISQDDQGRLWLGTAGGVSRYDGESFVNFTTRDGLAYNWVVSSVQDDQGRQWFGTAGGGISRYDGSIFTTFTELDGLSSGEVYAVLEDARGHLWFGTAGGLTQYDGEYFTQYDVDDGLAGNWVRAIERDENGGLWIGSFRGGLTHYDGESFTKVPMPPDSVANGIRTLFQQNSGPLWVSTYGGGVVRYESGEYTRFTAEDGLASNWIEAIIEDENGHIWLCAYDGGVSRFDGENFTRYTTEDGLAGNTVYAGLIDQEGDLWFGTFSGLSLLDGEGFRTFSMSDGLAGNAVTAIVEDSRGHLWFATEGGGVSRYDGKVFQRISVQDGLAHNSVWAIFEDSRGDIWFATNAGATRYSPTAHLPPTVYIEAVVADRRYEGVADVSISSRTNLVAFEFGSAGHSLRSGAMIYRYRLWGWDNKWHMTKTHRVEYEGLANGSYTFELNAIDQNLAYSQEPARVLLVIHPPYGQLVLIICLALAVTGAGGATYLAFKRRRERDIAREELMAEMAAELEKAHDLQMRLMPNQPPRVERLDIAGQCNPASHVGGDFFQYFEQDDSLALCLADVTGHAMEAAIPMVMFSGILERQMEEKGDLATLFARLNSSLFRMRTYNRTLVCFVMGSIDLSTHRLSLNNGGCPFPLRYSAARGEIDELDLSAYPLGASAASTYPTLEVQLEAGDYLVFCSDGIMEATNKAGDFFGYEQTAAVVLDACIRGLCSDALIAELFAQVKLFAADEPQEDDMTCVVLRVSV